MKNEERTTHQLTIKKPLTAYFLFFFFFATFFTPQIY